MMEKDLEKDTKVDKDKYTHLDMLADFVMVMVTGGFWLIWVVVRYLRTH